MLRARRWVAAAIVVAPLVLAVDALLLGIVVVESPHPGVALVRRVSGSSGEQVVYRDPHSGAASVGHVAAAHGLHPGQVMIRELAASYGPLPSVMVEGTLLASLDGASGLTLHR